MRARVLVVAALLLGLWVPPVAVASGGQKAVESGQTLAGQVEAVMTGRGFKSRSYGDWLARRDGTGDYLLSAVPYTTLYGGAGRESFRILSPRRGLEIGLVVKRQDSGGSTDTVLPYLYLTAIQAMPERQVFIILDGYGWRGGGLDWLRKAATERRYGMPPDKDVRVMTLAEFRAWAKAL